MSSNKERTANWNKTLYECCFAVLSKPVTLFSPDLSMLSILYSDSDNAVNEVLVSSGRYQLAVDKVALVCTQL
jgi:hypothetical protein